MKKLILIAVMASGLVACTQSPAPKEDSRLKEAYSACINTAQGSPEKIEACQSVLNVLKKEKQHQQFANEESVRVLDYQQCIQATRTVTIRPLMLIAIKSGRKSAARMPRSNSKNEKDNGRRIFRPFAFQSLFSTG